MHKYYNDTATVKEFYPYMQQYTENLITQAQSQEGELATFFVWGDWCARQVCVFFVKYMREKRRFGVCITVVSPSTTEKPIQHYAFLNFPQSQPCSREISQLTPPALPSQLSTTFCCWMR